jgi:hypothetical protein
VRYASGEVVLYASDLEGDGFGTAWGHTRNFANQLPQSTNVGNGYNWQVKEWSYLVIQPNLIVVMGEKTEAKSFSNAGGNNWVPNFSIRDSLIFDTLNNTFLLADLHGGVTTYSASTGVFQSYTDPAGNTTQVVSFLANGFNLGEVQRSFTSAGTTTIESFLYTYVNPTAPSPVVSNVLLRRQVGGGGWTNVAQANYTYYAAGNSFGSVNDLETVVTQHWNGSSWDTIGTTLYRYYLSAAV